MCEYQYGGVIYINPISQPAGSYKLGSVGTSFIAFSPCWLDYVNVGKNVDGIVCTDFVHIDSFFLPCGNPVTQPSPAQPRFLFPFTPSPYDTYRFRNPHPPPRPHNLPCASLAAAGRNCRCIPALRLSPTSHSPASPPRAAALISGPGPAPVGSLVVGLALGVVGWLTSRHRH